MVTLEEAVNLAKRDIGYKLDKTAIDYGDQYVFGYEQSEDVEDSIDLPGIAVKKKSGKVSSFFVPDYSLEYLNSGKEIDISKYL